MNAPLLNYTTTVEASKTVGEIQQHLVKHGCKQINLRFDDAGNINGLSWHVHLVHPTTKADLGEIPFKMPIDADAVLQRLKESGPPRYANRAQAYRVAWRILKDWVEAQMAVIETRQVMFAQAFLPYLELPGGESLFHHMIEGGFQMLALKAPEAVQS